MNDRFWLTALICHVSALSCHYKKSKKRGQIYFLFDPIVYECISPLYRDDLDLVDHQKLLKNELLRVDEERSALKERITAEGEAAKREGRRADRQQINQWKRRDDELLAYRAVEIRNKLGDLNEAIKQRNIATSGRGGASIAKNDVLATAFMETAQAILSETQYHQILQMAEGLKGG